MAGLEVLVSSLPLPVILLISAVISAMILFGILKNFSKADVEIKSPIYFGIGRITSYRLGLASPSLALMFDRNSCGENDIKIVPEIRRKLYLLLHQQNFPLVIMQLCPTRQRIFP